MQTNFTELRNFLLEQEGFENGMKKHPYMCTIKDNNEMTALEMLEFNNKIKPSSIVVRMPDNSYKEFWAEVYENQQNIPYDIRLPTYSAYYLIY